MLLGMLKMKNTPMFLGLFLGERFSHSIFLIIDIDDERFRDIFIFGDPTGSLHVFPQNGNEELQMANGRSEDKVMEGSMEGKVSSLFIFVF